MDPALALALYTLLAVLTPLLMIVLNVLLAPYGKGGRNKRVSFECGQRPIKWREAAFPVEYFPYAIIYVAYAVVGLIAFLAALAVAEHPELLVRVSVFLAALSAGAAYLGFSLRRLPQRLWGGVEDVEGDS